MSDDYLITMDLEGVGHIASHVAVALAEKYGFELQDDDLLLLGKAAGTAISEMHQRALFAQETQAEIDSLPSTDDTPTPEFVDPFGGGIRPAVHRPEFDGPS